ncbi:MAG: 16S rRNA (uracil(1498)-N(3))-methyltransferase [Lautropia sp.]|nr:16S rRNA (uracil(1498)-N(3))-methyltransferase [Lautropia sp.]
MIPRIHLPSLAERLHPDALPASVAPLPLDEPAAHHLLRVLRRQSGDEVEVFDGQGLACRAEIASTRPATVRLLARLPAEPAPRVALVLAQCLSSAEKMDWTIEKAVELGVSRIVPLLSARSVVKLDASRAERRLQHWQRLVVAAAMQCGRNRLPEVSAAQPLRAWLDALPPPEAHEQRWVLSPEAPHSLVNRAHAASGGTTAAWLLCGPEAGLAPEELAQAQARGWTPALLGPRVLRTETAGLVGLTVLQATLGDLGDEADLDNETASTGPSA